MPSEKRWGLGNRLLRCRTIQTGELTALFSKLEQQGAHWIWKGHINTYGYPNTWWRGKYEYVHRIFYTLFREGIREGDDIHHRCKLKGCVNPRHLKRQKHSTHASHHASGIEEEVPF